MRKTIKIFSVLCLMAFVMPVVAATRSAISSGTKIESATSVKSSECQDKYNACMDTGCIIDNDSGGRCQCSNKIKELNAQLNQIKKDYQKTAQLTEETVDKIKMGTRARSLVDDVYNEEDDEDVIFESSGSFGDKLRAEMHELCAEKLPECKSQMTLLKNMYVQKVRSDCAAYETALKSKGREARANMASAQKAVLDAALEDYAESNKYDLGQCVTKFTECMQTTAECGKDFTGCVDSVAKESIFGGVVNQVAIAGETTSVMIARSTMDMLNAKKVMCDDVTNNCVNARDKVWDTFLKTNAPQIKLAESKSESNIRTSCLDKISNCFVNACRDNISGDEESYNLCLTRPEAMKNLCKVELEPCLAATGGSYDAPEESTLWPSILAKLSAMRVDSCTMDMKKCMQSNDRCGPDYSQCIGLDTNIIMRMCPYDKLVGCEKVYGKEKVVGDAIYDEVAQMVEGIILNIDNEMLGTCEAAVDTAMSSVCGDSESCAQYVLGTKIGAQSLDYKVCQYSTDSPDSTKGFKWFDCRNSINEISDYELGRNKNATSEELGYVAPFAGVITGVIKWESVEITSDGMIDVEGYLDALSRQQDETISEHDKELVKSELLQLQNDINRVIKSVEDDNLVQYCMTGRTVPGVTDMFKNNKVRFPQLSNTVRRNIANAALAQAKENYYKKYDALSERMQTDLAKISKRLAENLKLNGEDAAKIAAREACVNMAAVSAFSKAPVGQSLWAKIMIGIIVVAAIVVACVFTCGAAGVGVASGLFYAGAAAALTSSMMFATSAGIAVAVTTAAVAAGTVAGVTADIVSSKAEQGEAEVGVPEKITETHGEYYAKEWNYQEKITTDFDNDTKVCKRCISKRRCKKTAWHLFSDRTCKKWETEDFVDEECTNMQF